VLILWGLLEREWDEQLTGLFEVALGEPKSLSKTVKDLVGYLRTLGKEAGRRGREPWDVCVAGPFGARSHEEGFFLIET
jgi:hypothetical protein